MDKETTRIYRIIRWLVWKFSPKFSVVGFENLPSEPCIIVGNHCHMYGPIACELYTPVKRYTWCAGEMMKRDDVPDYAYRDFWSQKPKYILWFYRLLSYLIAPLAECIFTNANALAVHRDTRLVTTYRESIARLQEGYSIVIFPECYTEHNNIVHEFQDKFVDLARFYHKKTGKELSFVPLYIAPNLSIMQYGVPIVFNANEPIKNERLRICNELMNAISELAAKLPIHTVIPYPNVPRNQYPKNIPIIQCDTSRVK